MLYVFAHQFYWDFRRLSEGRSRWLFDKDKFRKLEQQAESAEVQLTQEEEANVAEFAEKEIQNGRIQESDRGNWIREAEDGFRFAKRMDLFHKAADEARRPVKVRGEPEVLEVLLGPNTTAEQIRELCKDAVMRRTVTTGSEPGEVEVPAWPILAGSTLPTSLAEFPDHYVAALHDPRFPRCDVLQRPTNRLKQFWFLARALAGAVCGVKARTAINLVGSLRPEEILHEMRYGKPARRSRLRKTASAIAKK